MSRRYADSVSAKMVRWFKLLWDFVMCRRALAAHIAGLILFATKNGWTEVLKRHLMMTPPEGYRRVSWAELCATDQALYYSYVAVRCEAGTRAKTGELDGV